MRKIIIGLLAAGFIGFGLGDWRSLAADEVPASGAPSATPAPAGGAPAAGGGGAPAARLLVQPRNLASHAWPCHAAPRTRQKYAEGRAEIPTTPTLLPSPRRVITDTSLPVAMAVMVAAAEAASALR